MMATMRRMLRGRKQEGPFLVLQVRDAKKAESAGTFDPLVTGNISSFLTMYDLILEKVDES